MSALRPQAAAEAGERLAGHKQWVQELERLKNDAARAKTARYRCWRWPKAIDCFHE